MTDPEEAVLAALRRAIGSDIELSRELRLTQELGMSSLKTVTVITDVCEILGVDILQLADADLLTLETVGDLVTLFTRLRPDDAPSVAAENPVHGTSSATGGSVRPP